MDTNLKEKEVLIDIENREGSPGAQAEQGPSSGGKRGNASLKRLYSGVLSYNGPRDGEPGGEETTKLLADRNSGGQGKENESENEKRKGGKVKKAPKPPLPPKGPTLDAADMRLIKEITKIAKRKQERLERIKAIKKMKEEKALPASPSSSSPSLASTSATISAMLITGVFFILIILQGLGTSTSSNVILEGAPQPALETTGLSPIEFYKTVKTVMSDDGSTPILLPPKMTG